MSQKETPSGADVMRVMNRARIKLEFGHGIESMNLALEVAEARTAVAALLARNAELEAQTPSALNEKLRSCEEALQAVEAERDALLAANLCLSEKQKIWERARHNAASERDALAAEVGALRLDALRWREVSDKAWFVDAASYVYGLRTGSFGPTCDMDEVVSAIDAARAEAGNG